jgi:hypothetical protein
MKTGCYFLSLFIGLIPTVAFSQKKIDGLGIFRLGKTTTAVIDTLVLKQGYSLNRTRADATVQPDQKEIMEYLMDTSTAGKIVPFFPLISSHRSFGIDSIALDGVDIKSLTLEFFNDTLYSIKLLDPSPAFINRIEVEYGRPLSTKETKITPPCRTKNGVVYLPSKLITKYFRNDRIEASEVTINVFDNNCSKQQLIYFTVFDKAVSNRVRSKEISIRFGR